MTSEHIRELIEILINFIITEARLKFKWMNVYQVKFIYFSNSLYSSTLKANKNSILFDTLPTEHEGIFPT